MEERTKGVYLPVLRMWAESEMLKLCEAVANAENETDREKHMSLLIERGAKVSSLLLGVSYLTEVDTAEAEGAMLLAHAIGVIAVANDLFSSILTSDACNAEHRVAIVEWLADANEYFSNKEVT